MAQDSVSVCADADEAVDESDESNNCRQETWQCDTTALRIVNGPRVSELTSTSARICWDTDEASDGVVRYGVRAGLYTKTASDVSLVSAHCLNLTGLSPATTYGLLAESADARGNRVRSKAQLLRTLATPATQNPQVWLRLPDVISGTVSIEADASDDPTSPLHRPLLSAGNADGGTRQALLHHSNPARQVYIRVAPGLMQNCRRTQRGWLRFSALTHALKCALPTPHAQAVRRGPQYNCGRT